MLSGIVAEAAPAYLLATPAGPPARAVDVMAALPEGARAAFIDEDDEPLLAICAAATRQRRVAVNVINAEGLSMVRALADAAVPGDLLVVLDATVAPGWLPAAADTWTWLAGRGIRALLACLPAGGLIADDVPPGAWSVAVGLPGGAELRLLGSGLTAPTAGLASNA